MKHEDIISKLTLEEKASLTSGKDFWQTQNIDKYGIPSLFLSDGPHGLRKQAGNYDQIGLNKSLPATCFPTAVTVANSWDISLAHDIGKAIGEEAIYQGVDVVLGPGLNIKRNPLCGRNFEYFSEDPYLAGKMAANMVKGIQSTGVNSCVKHFAANSQETKRLVMDSIIDERTLHEIYLTNFEIAIKEGKPKAVMSAYNLINGTYCSENPYLLKSVLRDQRGFDGVVMTDWGADNVRVEALKNSTDLEMPGNVGETNSEIVEAISNGKLSVNFLDESCDRLIDLSLYPKPKKNNVNYDKYHGLSRKFAAETIVLLKNSRDTLPLKKGEKVAFIGPYAKRPRYQGAGSSIVNAFKVDSALNVVADSGIEFIGYKRGYDRYGKKDKKAMRKALVLAAKADVIIFFLGLDEVSEAEGIDRDSWKLPSNEIKLLKKISAIAKKVVGVVSCGSPVDLSFDIYCDALIHTYLGGEGGAHALLDVLTGKVNPSGKLSETIAMNYADYPSSKIYPAKERGALYKEGLYVGYRYFLTNSIPVRYPFGFGLSYTNFAFSNLMISKEKVTFSIQNIGKVDGKEVVQLYVGMNDSAIFRASRELKGFLKIELKAGEKKQVSIPFDEYSFRFFNTKKGAWDTEKGIYQIYIGDSSVNLPLFGEISILGSICDDIYDKKSLPHYFSGDVGDIKDSEFVKLYGKKLPFTGMPFYKKKRLVVDYNTTIEELRYAKGLAGRSLAFFFKLWVVWLNIKGDREMKNTVVMGIMSQPMRCISRMTMGKIKWAELNAIIEMFNGHFFKGLIHYNRAKRAKEVLI
jgi:beta-glucosidase